MRPLEVMPWGQTIAYVADINGFLVELRTHCQHKDRVDSRHIAVQRHLPARGAADNKLAFAVFHGALNQRAAGEDLDGVKNVADALGRRARVKLGDVVKEAIDVVQDFGGQLDAGHARGHLLSLRAAGLRAGWPWARAVR